MTLAIIGQALILHTLVVICFVWYRALVSRANTLEVTFRQCEAAIRLAAASAALASGALLLALLQGDRTLAYVAERTSRDLAVGFRLTAFWAGQSGSLLFWLVLLLGCAVVAARSMRRQHIGLATGVTTLGVLALIATFFSLLVAFVSRPFEVSQSIQPDGAGMSPSLQNYWMALHPPALYVGFVAIAVPFALWMGALVARDRSTAWLQLARRWAMVSWIGLGIGLVLGARWAYEEIGWGGYWAWDPVENAALMPWLTTTALLHSLSTQSRRGMMRGWNAMLIAGTFCLSIFGTFLTRSGVLSSVHSFVASSIGWWFIGFLAMAAIASAGLIIFRRDELRATEDVASVVSRETMFLFNGLLLIALALTVLWGVLYPILTAVVSGDRITLQAPWYNFFLAAFGIPVVALMSLAPFVPWRGTRIVHVARAAAIPFAASVAVGIVVAVRAPGMAPASIAGISFGAFSIIGVLEQLRRSSAQRRREVPQRWGSSTRWVLARQRRRYGGYLAHVGLGLSAIAIAGGAAGKVETTRTLAPGQVAKVSHWNLRYTKVIRRRASSSMQVRARFTVERGDQRVGTMDAGRNFYPASGEVTNEVGTRFDARTLGDLFITVDRLEENGTAQIKVIVNPLINLLWGAGLLMMTGGAIAAWPARRRDPARAADDQAPLPARREPERTVVRSS